jgi:primosomal protein N''
MNISKEVLLEDSQWCEEKIKALHQLIDDYECRIADNRKAIEEIESREDDNREARYDAWKESQYEN